MTAITQEEVDRIVADRLARDRKKREKELLAAHQQTARLSVENARLQEQNKRITRDSRRWEARAKANLKQAQAHQAVIVSNNQTIAALNAALNIREDQHND